MRVCVVCGNSLEGRRIDARHCGGPCRAEASRLRAILSGRGSGPYRSLAERLEARRKRTRGGSG
jgi:hypothetical protein